MAEKRPVTIVAANWWTQTIANPTFNGFYTGDRRSSMSMTMGHMKAMENIPTEKQLEQFCSLLAQRIEDALFKNARIKLDCIDGPCEILSEIAEKVGINLCLFPFERIMIVTLNSIILKDGYNAPWKELSSES